MTKSESTEILCYMHGDHTNIWLVFSEYTEKPLMKKRDKDLFCAIFAQTKVSYIPLLLIGS